MLKVVSEELDTLHSGYFDVEVQILALSSMISAIELDRCVHTLVQCLTFSQKKMTSNTVVALEQGGNVFVLDKCRYRRRRIHLHIG